LIREVRIIVWGINYSPEETGIGPFNFGMCGWLASRGHDIEMVTTFPYYPAWRKKDSDRGWLYRTDLIGAVKVRRCWHFVPSRVTSLKRIVHEATFIGTSFLRLLLMKRPDALIVISPPLPLGLPARLLGFIWRRPYVFHVQDLQPDAAVSLGMLKPGIFTRALYWLESVAYRGATIVGGISSGMQAAFLSKGVAAEKVVLFPNWIDGARGAQVSLSVGEAKSAFCTVHALDASKPLAIYSGNIGGKQGLGGILDAAATPPGRDIQWVIAGDGAGRRALEERKAQDALANVFLLPLQERGRFEEMLFAADACLVTQQRGSGQFFFPSKLLTLLTLGRPVVAVADDSSELAVAVKAAGVGDVVAPGDSTGLAHAIEKIAKADMDQRAKLSENGRSWVSQFERDKVLGEFEARLIALVHH
jgi:colanic acid biosynthesis glycosyl transferase WcaI